MASFWETHGRDFALGVLFTLGIVFAVAIVQRVFGMKKTVQKKHRH